MRSILSVDIENFQAHENLSVDFSHYTGITGPSNKGKTAVFRAINWCLYNSPSGSDFITKGKSKCRVALNFSDGLTIIRTKGSSINSYDIMPSGEEPIHLEGFGMGSVDEVVRAHGMQEIDFFGEKQSLNLCKQLSQPFFLGESPTTKAVMIGKLGKTDVIDLSIKNVSSEIRAKKAQAKEYKADLKEIKSELSELKGLSTMEKALDYADRRLEKMEYLDAKIKNIKLAISKIDNYQHKEVELGELIAHEDSVDECTKIMDCAIAINNKLVEIRKVSDELNAASNKLRAVEKTLDKCSIEEVDEVIDAIDRLLAVPAHISSIKDKASKIKRLNNTKKELDRLPNESVIDDACAQIDEALNIIESLSKIKRVNNRYQESVARELKGTKIISGLNTDQERAIKTYKDALTEARVCPVCMSDMTEETLSNIEGCI